MTVTRVEIVKSIEPGLTSVVLAASMKTPHRSLRSNEFDISPDGTLDVPMEVTFSLQVNFVQCYVFSCQHTVASCWSILCTRSNK